jgi:acetyl esterase/lipase
MRRDEPYISLIDHPFHTEAPLFVQTGTAEVLRDDAVAFVDNMKGISGNQIGLHEVLYVPHDTFVAGYCLGFATEPVASIAAVQLFFQSCRG